MSTIPVELLRLAADTPTPVSGAALAGGPAFAEVLSRARAGEIASGREVTIDPSLDLTLTPEQLRQIGHAADRAEAAGVQRLLVLMDGLALRVDLATRRVTGRAELEAGAVASDLDGVVRIEPAPPAATAPPASFSNASLLGALARTKEH